MPHFIFIQQISVLNILNMLYNVHFFSSSKCCLFHNTTLFGFCITHILNTGVPKFEKKKSVAKRLIVKCWNFENPRHAAFYCLLFPLSLGTNILVSNQLKKHTQLLRTLSMHISLYYINHWNYRVLQKSYYFR